MTWLLPLKLRSVVKENEKKNLHTGIIAYIEGLDKQRELLDYENN